MGRLSELALVLLLAWLFFPSLSRMVRGALGLTRPGRAAERAGAGDTARDRGRAAAGAPRAAETSGAETLERCAACGTHIPRSRALAGDVAQKGAGGTGGPRYYC